MEIKQVSVLTALLSANTTKWIITDVFGSMKMIARKVFIFLRYPLTKISSVARIFKRRSFHFLTPARLLSRKKEYKAEKSAVLPRSAKKRPKFKVYFAVLATIVLVVVGVSLARNRIGSKDEASGERVEVKGASAVQELDKEFSFPIKNSKGEEVDKIRYIIDKAELRNEIIVKGQKATSVKGRTFLILNLKLVNSFNQPIEIDTRDYVRLSVNGNKEEWLAPDIHNDPVEIQAISTKNTRVGFPINEDDRGLVIRIGEINGDKEEIELQLN